MLLRLCTALLLAEVNSEALLGSSDDGLAADALTVAVPLLVALLWCWCWLWLPPWLWWCCCFFCADTLATSTLSWSAGSCVRREESRLRTTLLEAAEASVLPAVAAAAAAATPSKDETSALAPAPSGAWAAEADFDLLLFFFFSNVLASAEASSSSSSSSSPTFSAADCSCCWRSSKASETLLRALAAAFLAFRFAAFFAFFAAAALSAALSTAEESLVAGARCATAPSTLLRGLPLLLSAVHVVSSPSFSALATRALRFPPLLAFDTALSLRRGEARPDEPPPAPFAAAAARRAARLRWSGWRAAMRASSLRLDCFDNFEGLVLQPGDADPSSSWPAEALSCWWKRACDAERWEDEAAASRCCWRALFAAAMASAPTTTSRS